MSKRTKWTWIIWSIYGIGAVLGFFGSLWCLPFLIVALLVAIKKKREENRERKLIERCE